MSIDPSIIIAIVSLFLATVSVVVTIIVLFFRGGYRFGELNQKVQALNQKVEALSETVETLRSDINKVNHLLTALANHRHDDPNGNATFVPPPGYPSV